MWGKRWCRCVWSLVFLFGSFFCLWSLSGSPKRPLACYLAYVPNFSLLLPNNFSIPPPYPLHTLPPQDPSTLINLTEFAFLSLTIPCNDTPLIVAAVHSAPQNFENRQAIRSTWGSSIRVVFMLGESKSNEVTSRLDLEIKAFGDIVQGSFLDTYRNLTYKHTMVLKWATYYCQGARYILKTDDDVFVHTVRLRKLIHNKLSPLGTRNLILCPVLVGYKAVRRRSKWRVSRSEYPYRYYPPYCSGWAVLYSPDVVFNLYSKAQQEPYFWIDDLHITGILAAIVNVAHTQAATLSRESCEELGESLTLVNSSGKDLIFCLTSKYTDLHRLWDLMNESLHSSASLAVTKTSGAVIMTTILYLMRLLRVKNCKTS